MLVKFDGDKIARDITWGDLEVLEAGRHKDSIEILSKFMQDENGVLMLPADAKKKLRGLKPAEAGAVITEFYKALRDGAINTPSAGT